MTIDWNAAEYLYRNDLALPAVQPTHSNFKWFSFEIMRLIHFSSSNKIEIEILGFGLHNT